MTTTRTQAFRSTRTRSNVLVLLVLCSFSGNFSSSKLYHHQALAADASAAAPWSSENGSDNDIKCNVEDLERANDSQLYTILQELVDTDYFRHFWVDLEHGCPLEEDDDEEFQCGASSSSSDGSHGSGTSLLDELDVDAEPSCTVDMDDNNNNANNGMFSNALHSIQSTGFESTAQKNTFKWDAHSDPVVDGTDPSTDSDFCDETFWNDLCSSIGQGQGTTHVNLSKNPEINTGYNGTHIWRAIYEENCVAVDDNNANVCLEERVLYRLLSGLHTQTTVGIAHQYYPPSVRKNRTQWEPNPKYFMEKLGKHPEYIRNLHFGYAVLLRALHKAGPVLYDIDISTGNVVQDQAARTLLQRLLDTPTSMPKSCSAVFDAFDESELFQQEEIIISSNPNEAESSFMGKNSDVIRLQRNFKGVFHNISSILDCVQCQQCKLHGKLAMTGYGAALKILLSPTTTASSGTTTSSMVLERNEIVALVNSVAKFSQAIRHVRELTQLYMAESAAAAAAASKNIGSGSSSGNNFIALDSIDLVDRAVGAIAQLGHQGLISPAREDELVQMAFNRNVDVLIAIKHYSNQDPERLVRVLERFGEPDSVTERLPDAIVVGSGLAGMAATLNILDRGGRVVMMEKEHLLGGNSNKASSGINAYSNGEESDIDEQSMAIFRNDTIKSAGSSARLDLIDQLVERSPRAVSWLKSRIGADLSLVARLGGHSLPRTHRPSNGMVGAEIIYGMQREVKKFIKTGQLQILVDTQVTKLITEGADNRVVGVEFKSTLDGDSSLQEKRAANVVLTTGGFAADRSQGSYLEQHRPELLKFPATAGPFSTGDGITLATTVGAGVVDMDKVQIHPTGWVDPAEPENTSKILAAELMRGVGGLLINTRGKRFCNEVGTRAYVSDQMLSHDPTFVKTHKWDMSKEIPEFYLVLSSSAAEDARKHVDLYRHKGLLTEVKSVGGLARFMNLPKQTIVQTLKSYLTQAETGEDQFGKRVFYGLPNPNLERETFYVGKVVPVLHYCMGGITIDTQGNVVSTGGNVIPGLHAAGEVTGGVHGVNRLGGNSLLECTVYGSVVGEKIPVSMPVKLSSSSNGGVLSSPSTSARQLRSVTLSELQQHNTPEDCWVSIHGTVYDLTEFADEHPAGPLSIQELAGQDGTKAFSAVHSLGILDDFEDERMGKLIDEQH